MVGILVVCIRCCHSLFQVPQPSQFVLTWNENGRNSLVFLTVVVVSVVVMAVVVVVMLLLS